MISKRNGLLIFLVWLVVPCAAFAQSQPSGLSVSPGTVYLPPGSPSCFTISVGNAANMYVDFQYYFQGNGPLDATGFLMDGNGQIHFCVDGANIPGEIVYTGIRNSELTFENYVPVYSSLAISSTPAPVIYSLGPTGDHWDYLWLSGAHFQQDSMVSVYVPGSTEHQDFYGPATGASPEMWVSGDGSLLTLQITNPTVRHSFGGNAGVHVQVVNPIWSPSEWATTYSPSPVIYSGDAGCGDPYCIWLSGSFPLDASVDFRAHGQPDIIPNSYSGLYGTSSLLSLQLNAGVRNIYDTVGLDVWVVNPLIPNWSWGYYLPPKDRAVIGNIDGVSLTGIVHGWACAKTYAGSIDVLVYIGGPEGAGTLAVRGTANLASEPDVATACNSTGTAYRFSLAIPPSFTQNNSGQPIYVHGTSPYGLEDSLIGSSGIPSVPAVDRSVTGYISDVVLMNQQYYLRGWACARTNPDSIDVLLHAGSPYGSETIVTSATANLSHSPAITASCNTGSTNYGFSIPLSQSVLQQFGGQRIYVRGISPFGLENSILGNSGVFTIPGGLPLTVSWKQDYIRDGAGAVLAIARPAPSNPNPPSVPSVLTVTDTSATSVSLSWQASTAAGGEMLIGYKIYRQLGSGASLPIGSVGHAPAATTVTFSDTTAQSGRTYIYTVVAVNATDVYSAGISVSVTTP